MFVCQHRYHEQNFHVAASLLYWLVSFYFQRKQEKEISLYGKVLSSDNADGEDGDKMDDDLPAPEPGEYKD